MQHEPDRIARVIGAALIATGYALTLWIFYPGIMTFDAKYVHGYAVEGVYGDWQSPVMTLLWAVIDPLAPGAASMFLLMATLYWLSFGLLALRIAARAPWVAVLAPMLALLPPAFVFTGVIWRDVLFAEVWLLAAVVAFYAVDRAAPVRIALQAFSLALCAFGVLLRPNALIAAAILAAYILWPTRFVWKRAAVLFIPALAIFFVLVQGIYYGALKSKHEHPLHSIMVFDLGGISHFSGQNQFPVTWTDAEEKLLLNGCYKPTDWDIYWTHERCSFVMRRVDGEGKLFGTPAIPSAWISAVLHHPVAYLEHRLGFFWNFSAGNNLTMWVRDIERDDQTATVFPGRPQFGALKSIHDALKPTPLFRVGTWLLLCMVIGIAGWRRRETPEGAFAIGVCASATLYVLTFLGVGVASDFRYGYWAVLAALAGGVAMLMPRRPA